MSNSNRVLSDVSLLFKQSSFELYQSSATTRAIVEEIFENEGFPRTGSGNFPLNEIECILATVQITSNCNDPVLKNQVSTELALYPEPILLNWIHKFTHSNKPKELQNGATIEVLTCDKDFNACRQWVSDGTFRLALVVFQNWITTNKYAIIRPSNTEELCSQGQAPQITSFFEFECWSQVDPVTKATVDIEIIKDVDKLFPTYGKASSGKSVDIDRTGITKYLLFQPKTGTTRLTYTSQDSNNTVSPSLSAGTSIYSGLIAANEEVSKNLRVLFCSRQTVKFNQVEVNYIVASIYRACNMTGRVPLQSNDVSNKQYRPDLEKISGDDLTHQKADVRTNDQQVKRVDVGKDEIQSKPTQTSGQFKQKPNRPRPGSRNRDNKRNVRTNALPSTDELRSIYTAIGNILGLNNNH